MAQTGFNTQTFDSGTGLLPGTPFDFRQCLIGALNAAAGVTAVVGTRIYPLILPQTNPSFPALLLRVVSNPRDHNLDGAAGLARARVEFKVLSRLLSDCAAGLEALRQLWDGYQGWFGVPEGGQVYTVETLVLDERDGYEEPDDGTDAGTFWIALDVLFRYRETIPAPRL